MVTEDRTSAIPESIIHKVSLLESAEVLRVEVIYFL